MFCFLVCATVHGAPSPGMVGPHIPGAAPGAVSPSVPAATLAPLKWPRDKPGGWTIRYTFQHENLALLSDKSADFTNSCCQMFPYFLISFKSTFAQSPAHHNIRNQFVTWLRLLVHFCPFSKYLGDKGVNLERLSIVGDTKLYPLNERPLKW